MAQSRVAIVGTGAVAQALGRLLSTAGEPVVALTGRSRSRAEQAASFIGESVRVVTYSELPHFATHVLIAVSDQGITPVAEALASEGLLSGVVLHTCGARGPEALAPLRAAGVAGGVLHPLQTIMTAEQGVKSLVGVTFGLSGDPPAVRWGEHIVTLVHGRSLHIDADRLSYYHAGAVMASNALVAVLDAAVRLMAQAGVDRQAALGALGPLARTSLDNVLERGPLAALTGPIARGDATTVAAHIQATGGVGPTVRALYEAAAEHLLELARQRGLPEASVRALQSVIGVRSL